MSKKVLFSSKKEEEKLWAFFTLTITPEKKTFSFILHLGMEQVASDK